ncbi:formyl-CoA transferase [Saccharopolyspora erythraea NRRL 2338]|uniref:L-carnitine dehydratase/bile acid-inducible protein F n=2 Tax=Saccharopolyspora erythraea TaxID=1836 RepID=A4FII2_SACEN|nr:CaiB/BaiF CoA-transferase family protein [Saccharopolyspora erythraea]EQD87863.1 CoA transferase [Saccharopolyspora erythraea D]PFG97533.1 formyl-CoA transferase [Saccharopolyspora erythraea NRRL 2338]QRK87707.1 CoA transferase [Saccharopolyspora erythraea]CAM03857.1 L-carnitine dehydratase/bile acid-inducible protein F [Saccharopolyspora erythraea NRRL 2338]
MTEPPLSGITVVSIEQAVAAPFATRQLADLGARVIKVERTGGGDFARRYDTTVHGQSSYFVWLNRSKESVALDLKSPRGREVLERLLATADVFVQNLAPGAAARLGVDAASLTRRYPSLIPCTVSGYGTSGPWADRKAYDLLVQCQTGLVSLTGDERGTARVGISVADIAAGMYAYSGVLTALFTRATTAVARAVEVSLFEALAEWMSQPADYTRHSGTQPPRIGTQHATIAPYGAYTAADGREVLFSIQNETEWAALCEQVLERPDLVADPRFATGSDRVAHRDELNAIVAERFGRGDSAEISKLLDQAGIANAGVNDVAEFLAHPVLSGRDRWRDVGIPGAVVPALVPPVDLAGVTPRMDPVPAAGEHTERLLTELGYSPGDIDGLRSGNVI